MSEIIVAVSLIVMAGGIVAGVLIGYTYIERINGQLAWIHEELMEANGKTPVVLQPGESISVQLFEENVTREPMEGSAP